MDIDAQLLDRYAHNRDAEAFTLLVRRHAGMVFAVARRMTRNHHDAEEVAQNCFLDLARQASSIRGSLAGWLHATATHCATDFNRAASIRRRHEVAAARVQTQVDSPWNEISPLVDAALAELPDDLRLPLVLFHLERRSQAEIAAELEIHQSTVSRRVEAAVAALREKLKGAGVMAPGLALPALLAQHAIEVVPKALMAELGKLAVSGVMPVTSGAVSGAASGAASGVAKGAVPLAAKIAAVLVAATAISTIGYRALRPPIQPVVAVSTGQAGGNTINDPGTLAGPELLKFLELQIKNARAKIKTLDAQVNYSYVSPPQVNMFEGKPMASPTHGDASIHYIADGGQRLILQTRNQEGPDETPPQHTTRRFVLNDNYSAWWWVGNSLAEQQDHKSIASRSERARTFEAIAAAGNSPFDYAFGVTALVNLDDMHAHDALWHNSWSAAEKTDSGVHWYEISVHRPDAAGKNVLVVVIRVDPSKDYLVTAAKGFYPDGLPSNEATVTAELNGQSGIWFPSHVVDRHIWERAARRYDKTGANDDRGHFASPDQRTHRSAAIPDHRLA